MSEDEKPRRAHSLNRASERGAGGGGHAQTRRKVLLLTGGDGALALALLLHLEADDLHALDVLDRLPQTLAEAGAEELVAALYEDELLDRPAASGDDLDALPTHRRQVLQLLARQVAQSPTYARHQPARERHVGV